jgi:hypothetical protein
VQAAVAAKQGDVARFGPNQCVSTWRNEDGHCEIATRCQAGAIKDYPIKLLCKDSDGQMVRHVFAPGSFDPEEQFDTLIPCEACLADASYVANEAGPYDDGEDSGSAQQESSSAGSSWFPPSGAKAPPAAPEEKASYQSSSGGGYPPVSHGALSGLRSQVQELEGFMKQTAAQVEKLTAKVNGDSGIGFSNTQASQLFSNAVEEDDGQSEAQALHAQSTEEDEEPGMPPPLPSPVREAMAPPPMPPSAINPPPLPPPAPERSMVHQESVRHRRQPRLSAPAAEVVALPAATKSHRQAEDEADNAYSDVSEEDADERARMQGWNAAVRENAARKVDDDDDEDGDVDVDGPSEPAQAPEMPAPAVEMVPVALEDSLLQSRGHQADGLRRGAFLQRGGDKDDDEDEDETDAQDTEEKLSAAEYSDDADDADENEDATRGHEDEESSPSDETEYEDSAKKPVVSFGSRHSSHASSDDEDDNAEQYSQGDSEDDAMPSPSKEQDGLEASADVAQAEHDDEDQESSQDGDEDDSE